MVLCVRALVFVPLFISSGVSVSPTLPAAPNPVFLQPSPKEGVAASAAKAAKAKSDPVDVMRIHDGALSAQSAYTAWRVAVSGSAVGVIFGLMGSGASMLMKPLLYYGFGQYPFKLTIFEMYSILVPLAFFGAARGHIKGNVVWHHVIILASFTSGIGTTLGSLLATAATSHSQLLLFGALVILVALHMASPDRGHLHMASARKGKDNVAQGGEAFRLASFDSSSVLLAIVVGILSGFVGVGGGFMLTPLLCHFGHSMDTAVPTALAVICLSACTGIFWNVRLGSIPITSLDGTLIASFALSGCLGLLASDHMSGLVQKSVKQKLFSALLVVIGTGVVLTETFAPMTPMH